MKNIKKYTGLLILLSIFISMAMSCSKDDNQPNSPNNNSNYSIETIRAQVNILPIEPLNTVELNTLSFMREEEKLARDVYINLYNKWGSNVFKNISSSEQTHMDAMLILLNRYNITDPVGSNAVGVFNNSTLQNLYNQLIVEGNISVLNAFKVGATIEDLDIFDLTNALSGIDNQDIRFVYENLSKGSRNHMRAFYKNILNSGGTYVPQYLTQADFDAIINSAMETGF